MAANKTKSGLGVQNIRNAGWGAENQEPCLVASRSHEAAAADNSAVVPPKTKKREKSQGNPAVLLLNTHPQEHQTRMEMCVCVCVSTARARVKGFGVCLAHTAFTEILFNKTQRVEKFKCPSGT